jgi:hypothetical protein
MTSIPQLQQRIIETHENSLKWKQEIVIEHVSCDGSIITEDIGKYICSPIGSTVCFSKTMNRTLPYNKDHKPFANDCNEWKALFTSLYFACKGAKIILNGEFKASMYDAYPLKRIICHRGTCYQNSKQCNNVEGADFDLGDHLSQFRKSTINNDYKNDRAAGFKKKENVRL